MQIGGERKNVLEQLVMAGAGGWRERERDTVLRAQRWVGRCFELTELVTRAGVRGCSPGQLSLEPQGKSFFSKERKLPHLLGQYIYLSPGSSVAVNGSPTSKYDQKTVYIS